jgi:ankyrin repeat protein
MAAGSGAETIADRLIAKGADVNMKDKAGKSPLYVASAQCQKAVAKLLINHGAEVNARCDTGDTPLHAVASVEFDPFSVANLLLAKDAFVDYRRSSPLKPVLEVDDGGIEWVHGNLAEFLIEKGADVNARNESGDTPLHKAASCGHGYLIEVLLSNGANMDAKNGDGNTPLHLAIEHEQSQVVELLHGHGAEE